MVAQFGVRQLDWLCLIEMCSEFDWNEYVRSKDDTACRQQDISSYTMPNNISSQKSTSEHFDFGGLYTMPNSW